MATVSKAWIDQIIATAEHCGVAREQLTQQASLQPIQMGQQTRYPLDDVVRLWGAAIELSKDPNFGLHMGEQMTPTRLNLISHVMMSSASFGEALAKTQRYQRLVSDGGDLELALEGETAKIIYTPRPDSLPFFEQQIEAAIAAIASMIRWGIGAQFVPISIGFQHASPEDTSEHQRIFACPVLFDQKNNFIALPVEQLQYQYENDDALASLHEQMAERMLAMLLQPSWKEQVKQLLACRLATGDVSKEALAKVLNTTPKTLSRRLADEDTSFQTILNDLRQALALQYLQQENLTLEDISALLGFTEPSAFYRAFKRWTGQTPSRYLELLS